MKILAVLTLAIIGAHGAVIHHTTGTGADFDSDSPHHAMSLTDHFGGLDSDTSLTLDASFPKPKPSHAPELASLVPEEHAELPESKPKPGESEHFIPIPIPHPSGPDSHLIIEDEEHKPKPTESEHVIELPHLAGAEEEHLIVEFPKPPEPETEFEHSDHDFVIETTHKPISLSSESDSVSVESDEDKKPHLPLLKVEVNSRRRRGADQYKHKEPIFEGSLKQQKRWLMGWGTGGEGMTTSLVRPDQLYGNGYQGYYQYQQVPGNQGLRRARMHIMADSMEGHHHDELEDGSSSLEHHHKLNKRHVLTTSKLMGEGEKESIHHESMEGMRGLNVGGYGSTLEITHGKYPAKLTSDLQHEHEQYLDDLKKHKGGVKIEMTRGYGSDSKPFYYWSDLTGLEHEDKHGFGMTKPFSPKIRTIELRLGHHGDQELEVGEAYTEKEGSRTARKMPSGSHSDYMGMEMGMDHGHGLTHE